MSYWLHISSIPGRTQTCGMMFHQKYDLYSLALYVVYNCFTVCTYSIHTQSQNTHTGQTELMLTQRYILATYSIVQNFGESNFSELIWLWFRPSNYRHMLCMCLTAIYVLDICQTLYYWDCLTVFSFLSLGHTKE